VGLIIGSVIFGFVEYISNYLQATSNIPAGLLLALPFFVTVIAMVMYSIFDSRIGQRGMRLSFFSNWRSGKGSPPPPTGDLPNSPAIKK
jgi:hypothetical protein